MNGYFRQAKSQEEPVLFSCFLASLLHFSCISYHIIYMEGGIHQCRCDPVIRNPLPPSSNASIHTQIILRLFISSYSFFYVIIFPNPHSSFFIFSFSVTHFYRFTRFYIKNPPPPFAYLLPQIRNAIFKRAQHLTLNT